MSSSSPTAVISADSSRKNRLAAELSQLLEDSSGIEVADGDVAVPFTELGLDSLFLTQFALAVQKKLKVKVTFRQLMEQYPTMEGLIDHIDAILPPEAEPAPAASPPQVSAAQPIPAVVPAPAAPAVAVSSAAAPILAAPLQALPLPRSSGASSTVQQLIDQQLRVMAQQLALLAGTPVAVATAPAAQPAAASLMPPVAVAQPVAAAPAPKQGAEIPTPPAASAGSPSGDAESGGPMKYDVKKAFGAIARITVAKTDEITQLQRARLDAFIRRYNARTKSSKRFAQENRAHMADPRVVTGFRPLVKELVYPIVVERSAGSRMWDIDGNEYIDALNGFGLNLFGWQPDFVTKAIEEQLHRGHEIGPQHPLTSEVARLVCELTGFDRAAFCNTGSEAVMGCMRIARTVTGRTKIALFTGSYHGIFDEVIVRGTKKRAIPAAPGIMPNTSENVLVLDYGTPETLEILKSQADELAAVLVEPVQSRRPDFQPGDFLREVRKLTEQAGALLIFDEVVNGFRTGPGGAQEYFGIRADLASYGKVVGGGLPIGVIAGKREYMDALDGGQWQFGDDSVPPVGVTYFAGTFVRHPLALAAAKAVLEHLKASGPALQRELNEKTSRFAAEINAFAKEIGAPVEVRHFASLWKTFYTSEQSFGDLLFFMMRDRGVHIWDGFPCFYTTAHSDADFAFIAKAFKDSLLEMQEGGFLPERKSVKQAGALDATTPPAPGARLGRDPTGNPAWYVPHPSQPGKYVKLELA